jgi:hypothetical protein
VKTIVQTYQDTHPLEDTFDIEPGTTERQVVEVIPDPLTEPVEYDEKDKEIERDLNTIYTQAITTAQNLDSEIDTMEPKYRARSLEVSAQMMTVALNAASQRLQLKMHKDKVSTAKKAASTPGTVNNNLIVADRNQILKMLQSQGTEPNDEQ